jgi:peptide/nickel transport system ATP-binding protein
MTPRLLLSEQGPPAPGDARTEGAGDATGADGARQDVVLSVRDLVVQFPQEHHVVTAVDGVSFDIKKGQRLGVVGESGSGKSTLALSVLGLLEPPAYVARGQIMLGTTDLLHASPAELRMVRGRRISMIFQDALGSLNPVMTVGRQLRESVELHLGATRTQSTSRAIDLLREVGISQPEARIHQYPHEFSGGMRQRVMIAIALAADPALLVADEPTTALDVTTQAEIVELLLRLSEERGLATMLITHDLGLVAGFAHDVLVMYAGAPVEYAAVDAIYQQPRHPYTRNLIAAAPQITRHRQRRLATIPGGLPDPGVLLTGCRYQPRCYLSHDREACRQLRPAFDPSVPAARAACHFSNEVMQEVLQTEGATTSATAMAHDTVGTAEAAEVLRVEGLVKTYTSRQGLWRRRNALRAVDTVSLAIRRGESFGLVGESGSGKTTLARLILGLSEPDAGLIIFEGSPTSARGRRLHRERRGRMQVVFQDPADSLNPLMTVEQIIAEPLLLQGRRGRPTAAGRVTELLQLVGLGSGYAQRSSVALSGGQRQRVAIARALATNPALIICDEPVSSLDVSVRAQILNLLDDVRTQLGIAYLFVSHDLAVVRHICDRVAVMYSGKIVELAEADDLFRAPQHPYTIALMSAVPLSDPVAERRRARTRLVGSAVRPDTGCPLAPRCWKAQDICTAHTPQLLEHAPGHWAACHFPQHAREGGILETR